ncbi:hypothetical protein PAPHI01_0471 [Pancytospora philotis]|nr:hypothetical protein PAPHI01_0471 [Pancytospora philotis]
MLAGVLSLLISMDCGGVRGTATAGAPKLTNIDYAKFGKLGTARYNFLENQVLDSLYRCCSRYDCPEIKRAMLDVRLLKTSFEDKVRYVLLTMLSKADQYGLTEQLYAKFSYAGRLLLRKLFSSSSIKSFTRNLESDGDSGPRYEFRRVALRCRHAAKRIYNSLEEKVAGESKKTLPQLAEDCSGQDLAIYTFRAMNTLNMTLSSAFTELVDSWASDNTKRDKLLPVIIEFVRILMKLNAQCVGAQVNLQETIVRHVYTSCGTKCECFELLNGFPSQKALSPTIQKYISGELNGDPSPNFVRKYLAYLQKYSTNYMQGAYNFFRPFLPPPADFHTSGSKWRSDPERFNLIALRWLREMFNGLCDSPPKNCDVVEIMRGYMDILDYEVFVRILLPLSWEKCKKLAAFMLERQNAEAAKKYQQGFDRTYQHMDLDSKHKKVLCVLASIFKRLAAYRSTLNERS